MRRRLQSLSALMFSRPAVAWLWWRTTPKIGPAPAMFFRRGRQTE